jgi:hypothetical protein
MLPIIYALSVPTFAEVNTICFLVDQCPELLTEVTQDGFGEGFTTATHCIASKSVICIERNALKYPEAFAEASDGNGRRPLNKLLSFSPLGAVRAIMENCPQSIEYSGDRLTLLHSCFDHEFPPLEVVEYIAQRFPSCVTAKAPPITNVLPIHLACRIPPDSHGRSHDVISFLLHWYPSSASRPYLFRRGNTELILLPVQLYVVKHFRPSGFDCDPKLVWSFIKAYPAALNPAKWEVNLWSASEDHSYSNQEKICLCLPPLKLAFERFSDANIPRRFLKECGMLDVLWTRKEVPLAFAKLWSSSPGCHPAAVVFHDWVRNKVNTEKKT